VRAIHEDGDGTLWLGTYDSGLFRLRDGRFTRYTTREGLFANGAFQIIEDDRRRFWISSNSGIYRVSRPDLNAFADGRITELTSVPYGRRDGMRNPECNGGAQPAGIRARDGRIWFPTQQGVAVFDPDTIPIETVPPPVLITAVLVADRPVPLADRVEIKTGPRSIEVQYAALTFIRPELTRFRYRIEGLDSRWIDAGQARAARFAQLPYGTFDFHVIAANRDGIWNTQGARVRIVVVPPFWRTPWFVALAFGAVAALALGVHRARIAHVRRQESLRAAFSRQLIDSQESDRRRIAAGLHDGLSQNLIVIRNWALLGQKTLPPDHAARQRLGEIESTAALALGEVRDVVHDLAPHNLARLGLAQTIKEMVDKVGESSGIRFTCHVAELDRAPAMPVQINLYRIVQEAINNVVKHSGAACAWVDMDTDLHTLRVVVRDDGRGFAAGTRPEPGKGGFGLFGMAERLRMIGGRLSIESAAGRGTTITIEVPLGDAP
jgi:signal transduction histidine kinase